MIIKKRYKERGNVFAWILTIVIFLVVLSGAYIGVLHLGYMETPEALTKIPFLQDLLPKEEEPEEVEVAELSLEDTLRQQVAITRSQLTASQARVATLENEISEKDRIVTEREDEIAYLRNALQMSIEQNIQGVAAIHEAMSAEESANILENLGAERASQILGAMREGSAGDILELMDEQFATQVTSILAGFEGETADYLEETSTIGTAEPLSIGSDGSPTLPSGGSP